MLLQYHSSFLFSRDIMGCPGFLHLKSVNRLSFSNWSNHLCDHANCGTSWCTLSVYCVRMCLIFGLICHQWVTFLAMLRDTEQSSFTISVTLTPSPVTSEFVLHVTPNFYPLFPQQQWPKCLCLPGTLPSIRGKGCAGNSRKDTVHGWLLAVNNAHKIHPWCKTKAFKIRQTLCVTCSGLSYRKMQ